LSGGHNTRRCDADSWTEEAGGAPTTAAWKPAHITGTTNTEPNPDTYIDSDSENRINADRRNDIGGDADPTMQDRPTTKQ
jgi:hypothetical protein